MTEGARGIAMTATGDKQCIYYMMTEALGKLQARMNVKGVAHLPRGC